MGDDPEGHDASADRIAEALAAAGVPDATIIPLKRAGWHAAYLYGANSTPRVWTASERSLLTEVADRAWASVERARAQERERRELDRTAILRDLASAAASSLERRELSERVMAVLEHRIGADSGAVQLLEDPRGPAYHVAGFGFTSDRPAASTTVLDRATMCGAAMLTGEVQVSHDDQSGAAPATAGPTTIDQRIVAIPMIARNEIVGCIELTFPNGRAFRPDELGFFAAVADQLAVGYESIIKVEERVRQLELTECLRGIQGALLTSDSPDAVRDSMGEALTALAADGAQYLVSRGDVWDVAESIDPDLLFGSDGVREALIHAVSTDDVTGGKPARGAARLSYVSEGDSHGFVVAPVAARFDGAVAFARVTGVFSAAETAFVEKFAEVLGLSLRERKIREERDWLSSSRREWLAGISHDLRTPLASIRGYAELLSSPHETPPSEVRREAALIATQSLRIQSLIADLLLTFQIAGGDLPVNNVITDLHEVAQQALRALRDDPRGAGRCVMLRRESSPTYARVDRRLVQRAIENLIVNALEHNPEGTSVSVTARRSGTISELVVEDDGVGMDEETLRRIVQRFVRGPSAGSDTDGVGLGMSTTRQLVELMHGELAVETAVGEGTTIRMRFPAEDDA